VFDWTSGADAIISGKKYRPIKPEKVLAAAKIGGRAQSDPVFNDIACDCTQIPWLRNLTVITQDESATSTPRARAGHQRR
jgi:hypothetical protein